MDKALHVEYHRNGTKNAWVQYNNTSNYVVIRYADDFIVLCRTKKDAESVYGLLTPYLKDMGLELA